MLLINCTNCKQPYPEQGVPYRCPKCGGLFDYSTPLTFDPALTDAEQPGIWRYRHSFGLLEHVAPISLAEGQTPLVQAEAFGHAVAFKCEFLNPTGSFKDRGSALIAAFLQARGVQMAVEDSSGNAGASLAAYAARAGLKARLYVPEAASGRKQAQIEAYGAELVRIPGSRADAADAVRDAAGHGLIYASHAYLPFNLPGYATLAYELVEQLGDAPGSLVVPVGQGGLTLGVARGFGALLNTGVIKRLPRLVGVQVRACAPLWALAAYGAAGLSMVAEAPTLAEGIRVRYPLRGDVVLQIVDEFLAVDEEEILPGQEALARCGFYVEPTSAVVWGALAQAVERLPEPVVVILTGSGFKGG
jgi:threonine synthase